METRIVTEQEFTIRLARTIKKGRIYELNSNPLIRVFVQKVVTDNGKPYVECLNQKKRVVKYAIVSFDYRFGLI
jgi:hypothetical protein